MRHSRPPKPGEFCAAWSSTTPPSMPVGSTWSRLRSVCSVARCLDRRIDDSKRLISEIAAWEQQRNVAGAHIKWMFTTEKARAKMGRAYPVTSKESCTTSGLRAGLVSDRRRLDYFGPRSHRPHHFGFPAEEIIDPRPCVDFGLAVFAFETAFGRTRASGQGKSSNAHSRLPRILTLKTSSPPAHTGGFSVCAEHDRQLGGGSPLSSLMAAKD
jgi:hypothetical protein